MALGSGGRGHAERYLRAYYAFLGAKAERASAGVIVDASQLRDMVQAYAGAGCHELLLFPCVADPGQADLLARAVLP